MRPKCAVSGHVIDPSNVAADKLRHGALVAGLIVCDGVTLRALKLTTKFDLRRRDGDSMVGGKSSCFSLVFRGIIVQ